MASGEPVRCVQPTRGLFSRMAGGLLVAPRLGRRHTRTTNLAVMSRYYGDEEGYHSWVHGQDFLSPDPPSRPLNRRRRYSREQWEEERPRLQRNYHSDNEAYHQQTIDEWEDNQQPLRRSESRRQRSSKQVPSPPRFDRGWEQAPATFRDGGTKDRSSRKQIPSPPPPRAGPQRRERRPSKTQAPFPPGPAANANAEPHYEYVPRVPEVNGEIRLRVDASNPVSLQYRASPPLPPTIISTTSESHPQRKKSISKKYAKRVPSPDISWRERKPSPIIDTRCVRYHIPSPPAINRRRHSDMDVRQQC